ncbi:DUF7793 family protein [Arthrobacter sp. RIT-PI-e]|uniref:DUF7793 family protein n=1 Tax=Arthrobacter sp. RIT-PI-e TaxID=1681197 RepID=UPI00128F834E|nr:STAS/SEC14 domain-containing protein [Arthrobacter sp. RIT-PI-e]
MSDETMFTEDPFTAQMRGHLIWVTWVPRMRVTEYEALRLAEHTHTLYTDLRAPMLVILNDMVSVSRGALKTFSHELNIAAVALTGPSAVDRFMSQYFTEVHHPPYPARHFDHVDEARSWLSTNPHAG